RSVLLGKAFAKCAPGDVFNADIGKAIAVGRLYGVKVPDVFFNAPKPTEVVVGMRARWTSRTHGGTFEYQVTPDELQLAQKDFHGGDPDWSTEIIDDTEAQYV